MNDSEKIYEKATEQAEIPHPTTANEGTAEAGAMTGSVTDADKKRDINPAEFLENEEFLEKNVYTNKRICEEIIDRYVVSLKNGRPPRVLSSGGNGASKIKTPTTLKEAKLLADAMFLSND